MEHMEASDMTAALLDELRDDSHGAVFAKAPEVHLQCINTRVYMYDSDDGPFDHRLWDKELNIDELVSIEQCRAPSNDFVDDALHAMGAIDPTLGLQFSAGESIDELIDRSLDEWAELEAQLFQPCDDPVVDDGNLDDEESSGEDGDIPPR